MASVELKDYSAYYKQKKTFLVAINKMNLSIPDGDFLVIIGPSGCGKTTLLKALLGSLDLTDGELLINGIPSQDTPIKLRNFSYVSQAFDLYKTMTIFENIAFPLRMMKVDIDEINQRVMQIADELDLTHLLSRKPRHLSIGQQQKVAIARALIKHPRVLLFDEPFSNLDAPKRQEMRRLIKKIYEKYQITTIFVTHDKDDALKLANHIAIIEFGKLIYHGKKDDLFTKAENASLRKYLYGE